MRTSDRAYQSEQLFGPDSEPDKAEIDFLKGSPRIALDIANPFTSYIFIEHDPRRIAELHALRVEYEGTRTIDIQEADANVALQAWLARGIDWKRHRAVVFLDPFGMQVSWATMELLARTRSIEVLINYPFGMAIQRLLMKSGDIPQEWQMSLDRFFGSQYWRHLAYEEGADLFGPKINKVSDSEIKLLEWYRGRLRSVFGHVSTARLIKNTRGGPLYYLIWAGPHGKGLVGAEHILSGGERVKP